VTGYLAARIFLLHNRRFDLIRYRHIVPLAGKVRFAV